MFNSPSKYFHSCMKFGDQYVYLKPTAESSLPTDFVYSIAEMLEHPGLYTWLYYIDHRNEKHFAAAKVLNYEEKMSKHKHIHMNVNARYVLLAGEIKVESPTHVIYNFESGTFMAKIAEDIQYSNYSVRNVTTRQKNAFEKLLTENNVETIEFSDDAFEKDFALNDDVVKKYIDKGYEVEYFNSSEGCKHGANNYMTNVMDGGKRGVAKTLRGRTMRGRTMRKKTMRGRR